MRKALLCLALLSVSFVANAEEGKDLVISTPQGGKVVAKYKKTIPCKELSVYEMELKVGHKERIIPVFKCGERIFFGSFKLQDGKLVPYEVAKEKELPFTKEEIEDLKGLIAPYKDILSEGKGEELYVFFDAFCPFCIRKFNKHYKELAEGYKVYLIPYPVHGEKSVYALGCMLTRAEKEKKPLAEVVREYFSKFNGNWRDYENLFKSCKVDGKVLVWLAQVLAWEEKEGISAHIMGQQQCLAPFDRDKIAVPTRYWVGKLGQRNTIDSKKVL